MIRVEPNTELVLSSPQHYHVQVITYESEVNGTFNWSTEFNLIANDITLAVDRAKSMADKHHAHVKTVTQCSDPAHLEGIT